METSQTAEAEFLIALGGRIRQLRKVRGMKQMKLAALCGFEKSSLSRIEAGQTNTTILTLQKIAGALGVPLSRLLSFGD